jgi:sugar/nucleoside kinase (ribokinase family)
MLIVAGSLLCGYHFHTEKLPEHGETRQATTLPLIGGRGWIQAMTASALGMPVHFYAAAGLELKDEPWQPLVQHAPLVAHLQTIFEAPTGQASWWSSGSEPARALTTNGANALFQTTAISDSMIHASDLILCQWECNKDAVRQLMLRAEKADKPVVLYPSPFAPEWIQSLQRASIVILEQETFTELIQILKPSGFGDFTANQLHALPDAHLHELCRTLKLNTVILKLGARGCFVSTMNIGRLIGAPMGHPTLAKLGFEDVFCGAFCAGWLKYRQDPFVATQFALKTSGLYVIHPRLWNELPDWKNLSI